MKTTPIQDAFFRSATLALRIAFIGFVVAAVGVATCFMGFAIGHRTVSIVGFVLCVSGVATGFLGILYGWVRHGSEIMKKAYTNYLKKGI